MAPNVNINRPFDARLFLVDQELDRGVGMMLAGERELAAVIETARKGAGLSKAEVQILIAIRYQPGLTVGDLRASLSMTTPTFARVIGELDKRGLIERDRAKSDRRKRRLNLSDAGTTLTTPIAILLRERLRKAYRVAGPDAIAGAVAFLEVLRDQST